ncbi:MAG: metallophosphatase, partial [Pyrinomonadaceae bacterium]|nr:metallophosphatase [Pyrinomonadaceae bacterium]
MITRRKFITASAACTTGLALGSSTALQLARARSVDSFAAPLLEPKPGEKLITILHTNDTHSQIDPLPANDRNAGKGGVARRATLVKRVRKENRNTLLIDAGDAFQGTPYFNLYRGEVEFKAMTAIGYDAMTLGNHDFDNGVDALASAMKFASFDFVSTNYDVRGTKIESRVKPYVVRNLGGVRVGLFGLGIKLEGLNPPDSIRG